MSSAPDRHLQQCFISAPFGLALGVLPELLAKRGVSWEWAKDATLQGQDAKMGIAAADFLLVVLNGTRADYRGAFDAGVAVGLGKPVLLIQTNARMLPLDFRSFTTVKASLSNRDALNFHLDLFLATPTSALRPADREVRGSLEQTPIPSKPDQSQIPFKSALELRAYEAIVAAGGSAIYEPRTDSEVRFRPDLLAWLGHLDAELLDPVVIEVKHRAEPITARRLEEQLLGFMHGARVRTALVVTVMPPPPREQQASPNVLWLTIDEFERLAQTGHLGVFVREMRNRILHGVQ